MSNFHPYNCSTSWPQSGKGAVSAVTRESLPPTSASSDRLGVGGIDEGRECRGLGVGAIDEGRELGGVAIENRGDGDPAATSPCAVMGASLLTLRNGSNGTLMRPGFWDILEAFVLGEWHA